MARNTDKQSITYSNAVKRTLAILETLDSSRRGLNISEMSRKLELPKSSVHVLMATLEQLGYIQKDNGSNNYFLGLKTYAFGRGMMNNLSLAEIALPHMRALVNELKLTSHLAVLDKDQGVFIQKVESPSLICFDTYVGRRMDLHCTGVGKVILAYESEDVLKRFFSKKSYIRYTNKTITSPRRLRQEINKVRQSGFAIDDEEEELEVRCVAVPVFNQAAKFAAALSVTGTLGQIPLPTIQSAADALKKAAANIFPGR
ncbi:MAG TPA: IclR family transcriptional regulator [Candidatus Angelobacter sp.]|nr:IclR family transcriptional regulator [Candidatus Angelobacter sp.]